MRPILLATLSLLVLAGTTTASRPRFHQLGDLPGGTVRSDATAVNADGTVVVGTSNSELGPQAFRWTQQTGMVGLGTLGGTPFHSAARAVSGDGRVVFGASIAPDDDNDPNSVPLVAFRWTMNG